jgi:large subunit ribosomal protein L4
LKTALSAKVASGQLIILDGEAVTDAKTKNMSETLKKMGISSALVVAGKEVDRNFSLSTRNIPDIDVLPSDGANVYDILRRDTLVLTKEAVANLTARLVGSEA